LKSSINHLQVKNKVRTSGCSENETTWVIAALPEASGLLVPKLVFAFSAVFTICFVVFELVEELVLSIVLWFHLTVVIRYEEGYVLTRVADLHFGVRLEL